MGILSGRDLLSGKYITAIITDSEDRGYFVALKHTLGNYFIVELNKKIFAFTLKNARMITVRETGTKSFRFIQYDTTNTHSLRPETKELELVLKKNALPKMNMMLFNILKLISRKEKDPFQNLNLAELVTEISAREAQFPEEVRNIKNYIESLDIDEIVTPVRRVVDFLTEDVIAEDAGFLGEMVPRLQRLDNEHKLTSNKPIGPKIAWMKFALIGLIIAMIIGVIIYGYQEGWFSIFTDLGKGFTGINLPPIGQFTPPGTHDSAYYQATYTPEELKAAIDRGEINFDELPQDIKDLVKNIKLPEVTITP